VIEALQFLATLSAALFAGAAIYINVGLHSVTSAIATLLMLFA
jgi:uncharacterized membrane protein